MSDGDARDPNSTDGVGREWFLRDTPLYRSAWGFRDDTIKLMILLLPLDELGLRGWSHRVTQADDGKCR